MNARQARQHRRACERTLGTKVHIKNRRGHWVAYEVVEVFPRHPSGPRVKLVDFSDYGRRREYSVIGFRRTREGGAR